MPTDPPPANQSNPPGPLGQAQPPAQQLPQQQIHYPFAQQQQTHIPLHPNQQPAALQHPQYGISGQPPLHSLPQVPPQRQSSQSRQPQQQQRAPMSQPQSPFFPGNGYPQHIHSYPGQQLQVGGYIYQGPTPYTYSMPPANARQQQTPVNSRTQRQFPPQPAASSSSQRTSSRPIPVPPPRKKNILQIVDPDTNEEVKVSNVDTRPSPKPVTSATTAHPPVKIPPRRSHALELVSDPADEPKDASDADKSMATATKQSSKPLGVTGDERKPKGISVVETQSVITHQTFPYEAKATSFTSNETELAVATKSMETEISSKVAEQQQSGPRVETVSSLMSDSVTTSPQPTCAEQEPQQTPAMEQVEPEKAKADITPFKSAHGGGMDQGAIKPTRDENMLPANQSLSESSAKDPNASAGTAPSKTADISSSSTRFASAGIRSPVKPSMIREEAVVSELTSMEAPKALISATERKKHPDAQSIPSEQTSQQLEKPSTLQSTAPAASPGTDKGTDVGPVKELTFEKGQRRVYVPSFMWDMKAMPNPKKSSEYEAALGSRDILKNGSSVRRSDSRGSRPVRGSTGPPDPRRAFPGQGGAGFPIAPMRGVAPPGMGGIGFDQFDLRSARSQAPPPAPKGQSSGRDGDPRGTRQQGSRGRFDGPTRQGQTPVDPFVMHPPVEKLKRTEKGWKRNREADDEVTAKVKTIRSLLNKLTLEKFEKIFKQIVDVGITSFEVLDGVVTEIFEKTLFEPKFSAMYAELCRRLEGALRDVLAKASISDADGKPITFRKILLNHCREEFTRFAQSSEAYENIDDQATQKAGEEAAQLTEDKKLTPAEREAKAKLKKEEEALKATKAKRRMLANVRFIGELFIKDLLRQQIIHKQCIQKLLSLGIEKKEEDTLEALCKLISKTGAKLSENKDATHYIDSYFGHLHALSMDHTLPARVRFMLQDLIEQRANNWKVRREEVGAKTIAEIHREVEKEERAKQEAQAAARERRRGGAAHSRSQQSFTPRVAMTMAPGRRSGPNVSRTNSVIEKFGNRTPTIPSNNFQSVRLGPGGMRQIGAGGSTSGPLRPGSGPTMMLNSFAPLTENRESGMNGQSGDVRRAKSTKLPSSSRRAPSRPQLMSADKLKQKTKAVFKEFWSVGLLDEVRQILTEEIQVPNYSTFMVEAIRISIDGKVDESEKSVGLLRDLAMEPLSGVDLVHGFSVFLSQLTDLEVDNPRVAEFLGKYIGAVASTRKLPEGAGVDFGLKFVTRAISETEDPKRVSKVFISIFSALQKELMTSIPNEHERTDVLRNAYASLGVDVAGLMNAWNPMRGLSSLEDMLKSNGVSFLAPYIKCEQNLKALLQGTPTGDEVLKVLKSSASLDEGLLRAVIRESLDWILMSPLENIKESFSTVIGTALRKAFGTGFAQDAQMGALLEAQFFVTRNLLNLSSRQVGLFDKPGAIAFDLLYDAQIVSRDTFVQWKEDTGKSLRVPGKDKMVIQTSQFFQWLAQLQQ